MLHYPFRAAALSLLVGVALPALAQAQDAAPEQIVVTGRGLDAAPAAVAYDVQEIDRDRLAVAASGRIEDALSAAAGGATSGPRVVKVVRGGKGELNLEID